MASGLAFARRGRDVELLLLLVGKLSQFVGVQILSHLQSLMEIRYQCCNALETSLGGGLKNASNRSVTPRFLDPFPGRRRCWGRTSRA